MVRGVILPYTRGGLVAAVLLGAGRALGEAIAVTQVIGRPRTSTSTVRTGDTLASRIAAQYQAAASNLQVASLFYLGLILLVISLIVNFSALLIVAGTRSRRGSDDGSRQHRAFSLKATGRVPAPQARQPHRRERPAFGGVPAIAVLALVVGLGLVRGDQALNLDLFTKSQVTFGETGGGIANALVGTAIMVGARDSDRAAGRRPDRDLRQRVRLRPRRALRSGSALDVLNGVPSIVDRHLRLRVLSSVRAHAALNGSLALVDRHAPGRGSRSTRRCSGSSPTRFATAASRWA